MSLAKEKDPNRKKKTITWDENCIREQDKERGTRMKIPEISTPFNYETWDSGSEEDFSSKAERLSQVQQTMREEVVHRLLEIKEDTEKKKLFEEQRKKHYDEYKTIKALKLTLDRKKGNYLTKSNIVYSQKSQKDNRL